MKRDMDIIRQIALASMAADGKPINSLPDVDRLVFAAHAQWMEEAGLIHAAIHPQDSKAPATQAVIFRLTWDGCEFAESVKDETLWGKAKKTVLMPSASWTFSILSDWLKREIGESLVKIGS